MFLIKMVLSEFSDLYKKLSNVMETKYVRIPFEVESAKRIQNKECEGRIVTRYGRNVRIVCFDAHCDNNIVALIEGENGVEFSKSYVSDGMVFHTGESECDLMLEIPEYMTFKDGDVIAFDESDAVLIVKGTPYKDEAGTIHSDCYAVLVNVFLYIGSNVIINRSRFATEAEKQKLIDALKVSKEPEAKECLKILGIELKPECEFKTGQPVIGIAGNGEWRYDLFSHFKPEYRNGNFVCSARSYSKCLPYNEQTAHLVGTKENWEE